MRGLLAEETWRKLTRLTVPGYLFSDLRRCNGVDPPSPRYGAASMEARSGGAVHPSGAGMERSEKLTDSDKRQNSTVIPSFSGWN